MERTIVYILFAFLIAVIAAYLQMKSTGFFDYYNDEDDED